MKKKKNTNEFSDDIEWRTGEFKSSLQRVAPLLLRSLNYGRVHRKALTSSSLFISPFSSLRRARQGPILAVLPRALRKERIVFVNVCSSRIESRETGALSLFLSLLDCHSARREREKESTSIHFPDERTNARFFSFSLLASHKQSSVRTECTLSLVMNCASGVNSP